MRFIAKIRGLFLLWILVINTVGLANAQGETWKVEEVAEADKIGLPAPDARHVAYGKRDVNRDEDTEAEFIHYTCRATLAGEDEVCIRIPFEFPERIRHFADWAPDSARLAIVRDGIGPADADIWIVDFEEETIRNLTDDGYDGSIVDTQSLGDRAMPLPYDRIPRWSPDGTRLAIERTYIASTWETWWSVVDVATGDVQDIAQRATSEADVPAQNNTVDLAWSPDGTRLAALAIQLITGGDPTVDGLWVINIEAREATLVYSTDLALELAQSAILETNSDNQQLERIDQWHVSWSPDDETILIYLTAYGQRTFRSDLSYFYNLADGTTEVVLATGEFQTFMESVWSPDGKALLVLLSGANLDIYDTQGDAPLLGDLSTTVYSSGVLLIDLTSGEQSLLGYLPRQDNIMASGLWGPQNNVVMGRYIISLMR